MNKKRIADEGKEEKQEFTREWKRERDLEIRWTTKIDDYLLLPKKSLKRILKRILKC